MRFLTVSLSPAIDATVRLDRWPNDGAVIKDAHEVQTAGGKGLNVARYLARRGVEVACTGLLGSDNDAAFVAELGRSQIKDDFYRVAGATRVNEMFVTPQGSFKVNRSAFANVDCDEAIAHVSSLIPLFDVVVLSGSLPLECRRDVYRELIEIATESHVISVLDASGVPLLEGLKAKPRIIKPNAEECLDIVGFAPQTHGEFQRATKCLRLEKGISEVLISDGARGCWFNGEFIAAPKVEVLDTTAAGDTLLAEWCYRTFVTKEKASASRWAVAAGSAACTMAGGEPPDFELVDKLYDEIGRF